MRVPEFSLQAQHVLPVAAIQCLELQVSVNKTENYTRSKWFLKPAHDAVFTNFGPHHVYHLQSGNGGTSALAVTC